MDYYMYVCPNCKKVYKIKGTSKLVKCPKCDNSHLIDMSILEDEWKTTSISDRHAIIDKKIHPTKIINDTISENADSIDSVDNNRGYFDSKLPVNPPDNDFKPKSTSFFDGFESNNTESTVTNTYIPPINNTTYNKSGSSSSDKIKPSGLSIGAFILSLFGCLSIIGIILGIADLKKGDSQSKHGLSIAAIIIGSILTLCTGVGVSAGFASGLSTATKDNAQVTDNSLTTVEASEESNEGTTSDKAQSERPDTDHEPNNARNITNEVSTKEISSEENLADENTSSSSEKSEVPEAKQTPTPTPEPATEPLTIIDSVIATRLLNVREQPNTNCKIVGKVAEGTKIDRYESMSNGWSKVLYNGDTAYINSKYLATESEYAAIRAQQAATVAVNDSPPERSLDNDRSESNSSGVGGDGSNFDTYDIPEQQNTADQWVLNTNSMKIHYPSCRSVKKISPANYATSNLSLQELLNQGYSRCGNCF